MTKLLRVIATTGLLSASLCSFADTQGDDVNQADLPPDPRLLELLGQQEELESLGVDIDFLINERLAHNKNSSAEEQRR